MHVPPAAIVPPVKLTDPAPATGAKVGAPQPETVAFGAGATCIAPGATGNVSENATPEIALAPFGFVIVNVSVVTPGARTGFGANSFAIAGGEIAVSVSVATLVVVVPVSVVKRKALTLVFVPGVVAVTLTLAVHE